MHPTLKAAFDAEMQCAERAWHVRTHLIAHWGKLRIGWRRRDLREIVGQLLRIPGGAIGSAIGRVPRGNTGGSNVSAFRPLPIPSDLRDLLVLDRRSRLG